MEIVDTIRVGSSSAYPTQDAVAEVLSQLAGGRYALVVYFSADRYDPDALASGLRSGFPPTTALIGCTTAGEIGPAGYQRDSLVAIAFPAADFKAATGIIPHLSNLDLGDCEQRIGAVLQNLPADEQGKDDAKKFAFMLVDGLSMREEPLGRAAQLVLGEIPVIGGSAGDSLRFARTYVFHDGQAYSDAAVVAIISTSLPCRILKTQHFVRTEGRMVVTAAKPAERIVTEINGLPAAQEYARIVGISVDDLSPMAFAAYPVVVRIGGQEYVRSIQKVNADNSLSFYCAIDEGIVLSRALGLDAVENLEHAIDAVASEIGTPQLILACDCILRRLEFGQVGLTEAISETLRKRKIVGFSTFGELHRGIHVNQTLTGVAFGSPLRWTADRMS